MSGRGQSPGGREADVLRVWLLGGFRVSVGPRSVAKGAWRLKKATALVKLLALAPDHRLHREQAMDLLWPNLGKKAASNNLRQALHVARRTLEPASDCLDLQDDLLALCPDCKLWVDVDAFQEAALEARRTREPAAYRAALNLYAGELLPGDLYEGWAEERRGELHQTNMSLLLELAALYEERGDLGAAIEALLRALIGEPTHEGAHARLMRLYALSGQTGEALAHYERLREDLSRGFATEPGAETQRVYEEILSGRISPSHPTREGDRQLEDRASATEHNLPAARTSFVGREREVLEVQRALAATRLLTLTGPGGTGKTRLALEVAGELVGAYEDGVWLVELAGLSEPTLVPQTVADVLGVREQADRPLTSTLVDTLGDKKLLLIMDNCEHLTDATARLTHALLSSCPHLKVLATSREALSVAGEMEWPVPPLSVPKVADRLTVEELEGYEAARLFAERALFVQRTLYGSAGFALASDNAPAVAEICRRLEGMPLAIELAAAWVGTLTVDQISKRLENTLGLLKSHSQGVAPRQRTLRGAIDWSYHLLSEPERTLFGRLSVFAGGWTIEAGEAIGAGGAVEEDEVLDLLWRLVNKSLVVAESRADGAAGYRMLEPIRQYAWKKLEESGGADDVRARHAAFYLALAEEAAPKLQGSQHKAWVERLERDHDNLRAALSWLIQRGEGEPTLRFGEALWRFWYTRGYLIEGIRWLERALRSAELAPTPARVGAIEGLGWLAQRQGDAGRAQRAYEEMLELSRVLGDLGCVATALNSLGSLAVAKADYERAKTLLEENLRVLRRLERNWNPAVKLKRYHTLILLGLLAINEEGDYARGMALWEEGLALVREVGDALQELTTLCNLGYAAVMWGDNERATALSEEAMAFQRQLGSAGIEVVTEIHVNLGLAARARGQHERSAASFREGLAIARQVGSTASVINALEGMAGLAANLGETPRAARLWGAAGAAREATGVVLPPGERALHEPCLNAARSRMGQVAWEAAVADGRTMSLDEASEYALSEGTGSTTQQTSLSLEQEVSAVSQPPILTRREKEIAALVARGLTSRQIATKLVLSAHTVDRHVNNILKKLGLHSREQIAAFMTD